MCPATLMKRTEALAESRPLCPDASVMEMIEDDSLAIKKVKSDMELKATQEAHRLHVAQIKQELVDKEFELQFAKHAQRKVLPPVKSEHEIITLSDSETNDGDDTFDLPAPKGDAVSSVKIPAQPSALDQVYVKMEKKQELSNADLDILTKSDSDCSLEKYMDESINSADASANLNDATFHNRYADVTTDDIDKVAEEEDALSMDKPTPGEEREEAEKGEEKEKGTTAAGPDQTQPAQ